MIVVAQPVSNGWKHFQARFAEWLNAAILFCWGVYILLHPGMMTDPRVEAIWIGLRAMASEQTWGLVAVIVGLLRAFALYINGHHKRTPMIRLVSSIFSALIFTQIVTGMLNANGPNTGIVVYTALVLADIHSAFRASADVTFVAHASKSQGDTESDNVVSLRASSKRD